MRIDQALLRLPVPALRALAMIAQPDAVASEFQIRKIEFFKYEKFRAQNALGTVAERNFDQRR